MKIEMDVISNINEFEVPEPFKTCINLYIEHSGAAIYQTAENDITEYFIREELDATFIEPRHELAYQMRETFKGILNHEIFNLNDVNDRTRKMAYELAIESLNHLIYN